MPNLAEDHRSRLAGGGWVEHQEQAEKVWGRPGGPGRCRGACRPRAHPTKPRSTPVAWCRGIVRSSGSFPRCVRDSRGDPGGGVPRVDAVGRDALGPGGRRRALAGTGPGPHACLPDSSAARKGARNWPRPGPLVIALPCRPAPPRPAGGAVLNLPGPDDREGSTTPGRVGTCDIARDGRPTGPQQDRGTGDRPRRHPSRERRPACGRSPARCSGVAPSGAGGPSSCRSGPTRPEGPLRPVDPGLCVVRP